MAASLTQDSMGAHTNESKSYSLATYGGPSQYLSDLTDPSDPKSVLKSLVVDGEDHTGDSSIVGSQVSNDPHSER